MAAIHYRSIKEVPENLRSAVWKASRELNGLRAQNKTDDGDTPAVCPADSQPAISDAPLEPKETPRFTSRVNVLVHSVRKRLADPDGISCKAELDSIVTAGLLRDDSCEEIGEVRFTQEKTKGEEYTTITIEEI